MQSKGPYNTIYACVEGTLPESEKELVTRGSELGIGALRLAVSVRKRTITTRSG